MHRILDVTNLEITFSRTEGIRAYEITMAGYERTRLGRHLLIIIDSYNKITFSLTKGIRTYEITTAGYEGIRLGRDLLTASTK